MPKSFEAQTARELAALRREVDRLYRRAPVVLSSAVLPAVKVQRQAAQSIANTSVVDVAWDAAVFNPAGLWAAGDPTKLTASADGKWLVVATVIWTVNATGRRETIVERTSPTYGSADMAFARDDATGNSQTTWQTVAAVLSLAAGDYVKVQVYQDSGGALNLYVGSPTFSSAQMVKVH